MRMSAIGESVPKAFLLKIVLKWARKKRNEFWWV